jgi:hypothetical protein
MRIDENSTMSNYVRHGLLKVDERESQDDEFSLQDYEYFDSSENDLDATEDDLEVIASVGWRIGTP